MANLEIILISGSLRSQSTHGAVIRALAALAPAGVRTPIYTGLATLPHFNPDLDRAPFPPAVAELRNLLDSASAVIVCVPEYAGAMPGSFKNLLEWTVSAASLYEKPVGWINPAAPLGRARDTYKGLRLVLGRAGARIVEGACMDLPIPPDALDDTGSIATEEIKAALRDALLHLSASAKD